MFAIDRNSYRAQNNYNCRIRFLVLHYTSVDFAHSIKTLTGEYVSSHYLIPDPSDVSYQAEGFQELKIFELVDESQRAWHAGVSAWQKRTHINDTSIGIELVNLSSHHQRKLCFRPFHEEQIQALIHLCHNILQRHPDIEPHRVIAHSDIAIGRKFDPGALFPWKRLYDAGIGAWYDESTQKAYIQKFQSQPPSQKACYQRLQRYGYTANSMDYDINSYRKLTSAFQMHFRPYLYNGQMDIETASILFALTDKYC